MVHRFWTVVTYGGYCTHGETFLDPEDILWWSKGGTLNGESLPRIRFLREIVESFNEPLECLEYPESQVPAFEKVKDNPKGISQIPGFANGLVMKPYEKLIATIDAARKCQGHCQEDVFLYYFGKQCTALGLISLPEDKRYMIEIIDVWNMTRVVVLHQASGEIEVPLPGKEGMAVLATRV